MNNKTLKLFILITLLILPGCGGESDKQMADMVLYTLPLIFITASILSIINSRIFDKEKNQPILKYCIGFISTTLATIIISLLTSEKPSDALIMLSPSGLIVIIFSFHLIFLLTKLLSFILHLTKKTNLRHLIPLIICLIYLSVTINALATGEFLQIQKEIYSSTIGSSFFILPIITIWFLTDMIILIIRFFKNKPQLTK